MCGLTAGPWRSSSSPRWNARSRPLVTSREDATARYFLIGFTLPSRRLISVSLTTVLLCSPPPPPHTHTHITTGALTGEEPDVSLLILRRQEKHCLLGGARRRSDRECRRQLSGDIAVYSWMCCDGESKETSGELGTCRRSPVTFPLFTFWHPSETSTPWPRVRGYDPQATLLYRAKDK